MKKLYFLPLLFLAFTGFAQKQIVVQNGTAQTFSDLNAAIAAATAGDTLYIPGGGFSVSAPVDKTLHWRGVGHYPDSTIATGHTQITNTVTFTGNCDNSTFEGIYFQYGANFGSTGNDATGIRIKYCRLDGSLNMRNNTDISGGNPDLNFKITESVITHINAYLGTNVRMEQNLIFGTLYNFYRCYFSHNSINTYVSYNRLIVNCQYCQFANNVFAQSYGFHGDTYNCNFKNNLFANNLIYDPATSTFTGSGNITNVGADNIYTSIELGIRYFDYKNDYHLNPAATGTDEGGNTGVSILGKATDGTDAGIYGTSLPYKEGAVPYAPHIRSAEVGDEATNGELGVKITVAAQER
ncbi:MAG: hypothetical protein H6536_00095 [Bacteroidales bacterium]|nr:hypothetical protein [Bacteroidales bacterium]